MVLSLREVLAEEDVFGGRDETRTYNGNSSPLAHQWIKYVTIREEKLEPNSVLLNRP